MKFEYPLWFIGSEDGCSGAKRNEVSRWLVLKHQSSLSMVMAWQRFLAVSPAVAPCHVSPRATVIAKLQRTTHPICASIYFLVKVHFVHHNYAPTRKQEIACAPGC